MNFLKTILFATLAVIACSCSNNNQFRIEGFIKNANHKTVYFEQLNINGTTALDSVKLNSNGHFNFSTPRLAYPSFFLLKLDKNNFITLLGDTTEKVELNADANNFTTTYKVRNSMGSSYVKTLNKKLEITTNGLDSISSIYKTLSKDKVNEKKELANNMETLIAKQKQFISEFVMTNPRSFASYYAVFQRLNSSNLILNPYNKKDLNIFSTVATSLSLLYPNSARVKQLTNFILTIRKEQNAAKLRAKLLSKATNNIPDIKEKDINGKEHRLSDLKGKMVLLSFWASWDSASRRENINLKKIYDKYKSKGFVIYQVSLDRSHILWEDAIVKDKLPWINVSDLKYTASLPARTYNIKQLPANYLINKNQEIIGKNLFGRILDDKLNTLLK